ncbi:MAG: MATE family efflux transporter [Bacteroidales bacterium]|nr:MATE family efflux transporter [Bacteroidales bacterium]
MSATKDVLLNDIRSGASLGLRERVRLTLLLSGPAILAQFASVLLQFIDASMVGSLGAGPSASIGLVSTSTWLCGGFCIALAQGFSVQVAHRVGAGDFAGARQVLRQGLVSVAIFSMALSLIAIGISGPLPHWLGGEEAIRADGTAYFRIYACFLPMMQMGFFASTMLQCSGEMKLPSLLNILMCVLDVVFNFLLIFPTREVRVFGAGITLPGAGMGVRGAALGTGLAETVVAILILYFLLVRNRNLAIAGEKGSFRPERTCLKRAFGITGPMWLQNIVMRGAYVMSTLIVAPLGAVSIAANSFAIIAESFCYMPGYGMGDAATTLVGQSLGAGRKELARAFSRVTLALGIGIMVALAVAMFFLATPIMRLLSVDPDVVALGARCLRLEAFAEAGYAASIVANGSCVGAGDTKVPAALNLMSVWVVRIGLALWLTPRIGLMGYWIAMCIELNVRGVFYLLRVRGNRWMEHNLTNTILEYESN